MVKTESTKEIVYDADGTMTSHETIKTTNYDKSSEPDYIKLYTKIWCEFNAIPLKYQQLFLCLAMRMSYCNSHDIQNSQLVYTGKPFSDAIIKECGWKRTDALMKGLKALCDCNAIRKINRGVYQINPSYAGKGSWNYNSKLENGGVKDLISTFKFKEGTVETKIVWADNGDEDDSMNQFYRDMLGTRSSDGTVLKTIDMEIPKNEGETDSDTAGAFHGNRPIPLVRCTE